jgi:hypothetical protein
MQRTSGSAGRVVNGPTLSGTVALYAQLFEKDHLMPLQVRQAIQTTHLTKILGNQSIRVRRIEHEEIERENDGPHTN